MFVTLMDLHQHPHYTGHMVEFRDDSGDDDTIQLIFIHSITADKKEVRLGGGINRKMVGANTDTNFNTNTNTGLVYCLSCHRTDATKVLVAYPSCRSSHFVFGWGRL